MFFNFLTFCILIFFFFYWYCIKTILVIKKHSKLTPTKCQSFLFSCLILFLRGQVPFYSISFHKAISSQVINKITCPHKLSLLIPAIVRMGMSWTLFLGYPSYLLSKKIGATNSAIFASFINTLAYLCLFYFSYSAALGCVLFLALSHVLFLNSHTQICYLFPNNSFIILSILGMVSELSVYGPWLFHGFHNHLRSYYIFLVLGINMFCMTIDLWILPQTETNFLIETELKKNKKNSSCFQKTSSTLATFRSNIINDLQQIGNVLKICNFNKETMSLKIIRKYFCNVFKKSKNDITSEKLDSYINTLSVNNSSIDSNCFLPLLHHHNDTLTGISRKQDTDLFLQHISKNGLKSQFFKNEDASRINSFSPESVSCKRPLTKSYKNPCIFFLFFVFFTVSFLRKKFMVFELKEYLFRDENFHKLNYLSETEKFQSIERNLLCFQNLLGLSSTGFFFWSVLFCHMGLANYMFLSNLVGFITLLLLYIFPHALTTVSIIFFLIQQSSISGFPLAAYGSLSNWSKDHEHYIGFLCLTTSSFSLLQDILFLYCIEKRFYWLHLPVKFLLAFSGIAFGVPLLSRRYFNKNACLKNYMQDTNLHAMLIARQRDEKQILYKFSSTNVLKPFHKKIFFLPLFQYFNAFCIMKLENVSKKKY